MHPSRPVPAPVPRTQLADPAGPGAVLTGGLVHAVASSTVCFLLPRVHAADMAAVQTSSSTSPGRHSGSTVRPAAEPEFPETGWDRIKELFKPDSDKRYPEETINVIKSGLFAAVAGMLYGGVPAAHHARQRYIQLSQAEVFSGRLDAVRSAHNAAIRGFLRYGWRWGWRVAVFVTIFNSVSIGLSVYRDKSSMGHYSAAGAVTGSLFRLNLGLRGMLAGMVIGAVLGAPTGAFITALQSLTGETERERRRRERVEGHNVKLAEWSARMQLTEDLISELEMSSQAEDLLSMMPNEDRDGQR